MKPTMLLQLVILLVAAALLTASVRWDNAAVAAMEPQATATPNPCEEWAKAGAQIIFKCIDDEPPYAICYVPVGGVMQCLKE